MYAFDHIAFQVRDMDVAIDFYAGKLGFALASRVLHDEVGEETAFLTLGAVRLELIRDTQRTAAPVPEPQPPYCPHLALETNDMAHTVAHLREWGIPILRGPLAIEGEETWVYLTDPDGNVLEFIQWFR